MLVEDAFITISFETLTILFPPVYASTVFVILLTPTEAPTAAVPATAAVPTVSEIFTVFLASRVRLAAFILELSKV